MKKSLFLKLAGIYKVKPLLYYRRSYRYLGFPGGASSKKYIPDNAGDIRNVTSIPGPGRSLEEGMTTHSNILSWRIPIDRGAWQATVHGVTKSQRRLKLLRVDSMSRYLLFIKYCHNSI